MGIAPIVPPARDLADEQRRDIEQAGLVQTWVHPDHWTAVDRVMSPAREKP